MNDAQRALLDACLVLQSRRILYDVHNLLCVCDPCFFKMRVTISNSSGAEFLQFDFISIFTSYYHALETLSTKKHAFEKIYDFSVDSSIMLHALAKWTPVFFVRSGKYKFSNLSVVLMEVFRTPDFTSSTKHTTKSVRKCIQFAIVALYKVPRSRNRQLLCTTVQLVANVFYK